MVRLWAAEGNSVVSFAGSNDFNAAMLDLYRQQAEAAGRGVRRGEGLVAGGSLAIAPTRGEADTRQAEFAEWYQAYYSCPPYNLPHGKAFHGTPQQIVDQIGEIYDQLGVTEVMVLSNVGAPHGYEACLEMLELFGSEVLPAVAGLGEAAASASELVR
jgi:alkanesulfonate monooxygenase SsuD/methylene tetrahydromethanopterin reductase-like flavin-dependent oxidoreductase (luciferase family)